jgi:mannose-6-phosphate isomerase
MSPPRTPALYPLAFEPIFQYRLWGGRALGPWLNRPLPGDEPVGEAWVLSDRADHASPVANGPLKGQTLTQLMQQSPDQILGGLTGRFKRFPLLLKFLDVRKMLSVQVHPRDDQTELIPPGDSGKTEAWVVLEADPEGRIYAGLKPHTTAEDLRTLTARTVDEHLPSFRPEAGQGVLIEAGTVHSLGDGVMVFEVQENSDVTFRLYDWDHVDPKTGQRRALQVEQALACIDLAQGPISPVRPAVETPLPTKRETLFDNAHFHLRRIEASEPFDVGAPGEPRVLVQIEGDSALEHDEVDYPIGRGAVALLPASVGACRVRPLRPCTLLEISVPDPS